MPLPHPTGRCLPLEKLSQRRAGGRLGAFCALLLSGAALFCALVWSFTGADAWLTDAVPQQAAIVSPVLYVPARADEAPAHSGALLKVGNIEQKPELPNGCEATSLTILLTYLGYSVDKTDIADDYLPKQAFEETRYGVRNGHPEEVYPGNPRPGGTGYYCYPGVLATAGNLYLEEQDAPYRALDITGADEEALLTLLDQGVPVVVWNTIGNAEPALSGTMRWFLGDSEEVYVPYVNLHVSVLRGYDGENFYFCDPLGNTEQLERAAFMDIYRQMGSRAMVIDSAEGLAGYQLTQANRPKAAEAEATTGEPAEQQTPPENPGEPEAPAGDEADAPMGGETETGEAQSGQQAEPGDFRSREAAEQAEALAWMQANYPWLYRW